VTTAARRLVMHALAPLLLLLLPPHAGAGVAGEPPGTRVVVGEHHLHIHCTGTGTPAVIMDAGLGGTSLDWARVQPRIARHTRACTYDRAGYGWSDSGPQPRTSLTIARELYALLSAAQVPGPYVLVGHSFGGFNVRLFATLYPEDTAALVLVDAAHEEQFERMENGRSKVVIAPTGAFMLGAPPPVHPKLPYDVRPVVQALASRMRSHSALRSELAAFRESARQVKRFAERSTVPLVVISRGRQEWPDNRRGAEMERIWRELQDDLTRTGTHVLRMKAVRSGHYVQLDQPEVVVKGVVLAVAISRR
jgi:pimeloyl-ACP methyl ester carboxylesterase